MAPSQYLLAFIAMYFARSFRLYLLATLFASSLSLTACPSSDDDDTTIVDDPLDPPEDDIADCKNDPRIECPCQPLTNTAPEARPVIAAANAEIIAGRTLDLDGRRSDDPIDDEPVLYFRWTLVSAPPRSKASIQGATANVASFTPDVAGNYGVELEVSDGCGWSEPSPLNFSANAGSIIFAIQKPFTGSGQVTDGSGTLLVQSLTNRLQKKELHTGKRNPTALLIDGDNAYLLHDPSDTEASLDRINLTAALAGNVEISATEAVAANPIDMAPYRFGSEQASVFVISQKPAEERLVRYSLPDPAADEPAFFPLSTFENFASDKPRRVAIDSERVYVLASNGNHSYLYRFDTNLNWLDSARIDLGPGICADMHFSETTIRFACAFVAGNALDGRPNNNVRSYDKASLTLQSELNDSHDIQFEVPTVVGGAEGWTGSDFLFATGAELPLPAGETSTECKVCECDPRDDPSTCDAEACACKNTGCADCWCREDACDPPTSYTQTINGVQTTEYVYSCEECSQSISCNVAVRSLGIIENVCDETGEGALAMSCDTSACVGDDCPAMASLLEYCNADCELSSCDASACLATLCPASDPNCSLLTDTCDIGFCQAETCDLAKCDAERCELSGCENCGCEERACGNRDSKGRLYRVSPEGELQPFGSYSSLRLQDHPYRLLNLGGHTVLLLHNHNDYACSGSGLSLSCSHKVAGKILMLDAEAREQLMQGDQNRLFDEYFNPDYVVMSGRPMAAQLY